MSKLLPILSLPVFLLGCNLGDPVQPARTENDLTYSASTSFWTLFSSGDREIATTQGVGVAVIDYSGPNSMYKWIGTYGGGYWTYFGAGGSKIAMSPNGDPVVTWSNGYAYKYVMATNTWQYMPYGYTVRDVAIGGANGNTWILSTQLHSGGNYWVGMQNPNGTFSWVGAGTKIAAYGSIGGMYNSAAVIDASGHLSYWNGAYWIQMVPSGAAVGALVTDIAIGADNDFYAVGNDFDANGNATVWHLAGPTWENFDGIRGVRVAVGTAVDVFVVQANGTTMHHYYN